MQDLKSVLTRLKISVPTSMWQKEITLELPRSEVGEYKTGSVIKVGWNAEDAIFVTE